MLSVSRWVTRLFRKPKEKEDRELTVEERIQNESEGHRKSNRDIMDEKYWLFGQPSLEAESSFLHVDRNELMNRQLRQKLEDRVQQLEKRLRRTGNQ